MRKFSHVIGVLLAVACSAVHRPAAAQEAQEQARGGAIADSLSTAMGLAAHVVDVHPLLPLAGLGFKAATLRYAESVPEVEQPATYAFAAATWQGTAANNVCMTVSVLTGGAFLPACVAVGLAWGMKTWNDTEPERRFWERCAVLREFTGQPGLPCILMEPGATVAEAARPAPAAQELVAP